MSVRTILAALCLTEPTAGVFRQAVELTKFYNARLIALNVINIRDVQEISKVESMGYDVHTDDYSRDFKEERREEMSGITSGSGLPSDRLKLLVRIGHPAEQILNIIDDERVDLVVMGGKPRSHLPHLLGGGVADKVFRNSPATVISYREPRAAQKLREHTQK